MTDQENPTNPLEEKGPWISSLPAMIAALKSDVPLEALGELRTDLVSMALLADRFVRLAEGPTAEEWEPCMDAASPEGKHKRTPNCIYCGGLP